MATGAVVGGHEVMADHQGEGEHAAGLDLILIGADRAGQQARVVHAPVVNAPEPATAWSRRAQSRMARSIGSSSAEKVSAPASRSLALTSPAQFAADRIRRPDVQSLLTKVSAWPNAAHTDVYPQQMPAKITVRLKDGTMFSHEVRDFPGMPSHPFTWDDVVGKFDQLVAGRIGSDLANQIKETVRSVEQIQVKDLMAVLTRVRVG
jgi:MmgE/PrpD C-terminal domain